MTSPTAKFLPHDKMAVALGTLTIHCGYWVEWADDRWHVEVERIENGAGGELPSFERASELIREALGAATSLRILVKEKRPNKSLQTTSGSVTPTADAGVAPSPTVADL